MITELLCRRLLSGVPLAFERPIPQIKIEMFKRDPEMLPYLMSQSGVSFPVLALELVGAQKMGQVQETFQIEVQNQYKARGISPMKSVQAVIQPGTPQNILAHELEHGVALSVKKRWGAQIRLAFVCASDPTILGIIGICDFGNHHLSATDGAIACSNPKWLSQDDIVLATMLAFATHDADFVAEIDRRIASRGKISEY